MRLVSQTFASWNRIGEWLRRVNSLRLSAAGDDELLLGAIPRRRSPVTC